MVDADLARLFENAFPNTLDTTVSWHVDGSDSSALKSRPKHTQYLMGTSSNWEGPQSFIVTGDITAEWLRDSTNQLQGYQALASKDPALFKLILGAINTQVELVMQSPYCNAFQPPPPSGLAPSENGGGDTVSPAYDSNVVFECKYELDSLAHFLKLGNEFYSHTQSTDFLTKRWYAALDSVMEVLQDQSLPTFNQSTGEHIHNEYRFRRQTTAGTETLSLGGLGNPLNGGTGLVRSAFRPSDDATILPYFIPANAMMAVELERTAAILTTVGKTKLASKVSKQARAMKEGIQNHGIVRHNIYGDVYAFEVDGYGSHIMMDDANLPSLLSLPVLGFVETTDKVYQNTRKMILEQRGNPYYLTGDRFSGIGGPHIGLRHAWPMSRLVQAMTSDNDREIQDCITAVKNSSRLGLIHESVNVDYFTDFTSKVVAYPAASFANDFKGVGLLGQTLCLLKPSLILLPGSLIYYLEMVLGLTKLAQVSEKVGETISHHGSYIYSRASEGQDRIAARTKMSLDGMHQSCGLRDPVQTRAPELPTMTNQVRESTKSHLGMIQFFLLRMRFL